ncbi:MAG: DUF3341 domain-containing protein [Acidobacteria bacterium]|nr:DUF3341 domain-containing protein [Acidobacteriota bacterium]
MNKEEKAALYGLLAEFNTPDELVNAAKKTYDAGYRQIDAYSPYPIEEAAEAIGFHKNAVPLITLCAGIMGGLTGFGMQVFMNLYHYPLNIGGRPHYSWPSFIPITFELTVLFAAFTGAISMLVLNGLPMPYHPLFNVERFSRATQDKFFLCIESADPKFDLAETRKFLNALNPSEVFDVEP